MNLEAIFVSCIVTVFTLQKFLFRILSVVVRLQLDKFVVVKPKVHEEVLLVTERLITKPTQKLLRLSADKESGFKFSLQVRLDPVLFQEVVAQELLLALFANPPLSRGNLHQDSSVN